MSSSKRARRPMLALSRPKKIAFAILTASLAFLTFGSGLLALDIYLHHRVQDLAGVNVWGYRGPALGRKQPDEIRVVVVGGSTAFGLGLPWTEALPHVLEQRVSHALPERRVSVVNLGAPGQGAYGFRFDLADYRYLQYSVAIFYEGYNDLIGWKDLPDGVRSRSGPNYLLWRRQSPVFRLTGYFPIAPLVMREKALAIRSGGRLSAAYEGRVIFRPGLVARATAGTLQASADVADALGAELGRLTRAPRSADSVNEAEAKTWTHYVTSVTEAVEYARASGVKVLVVTQPYASDQHVEQQHTLAAALESRFGRDRSVKYLNLGTLVNLRDRQVAPDGLHLVAKANALIADRLTQPILDLLNER